MRIIEWNCQGAFRNKNKEVLDKKPDILVIPECEQGEKLQFGFLTPKPNDFYWYGDNGKKGVGVFSYSNYKFSILKEFNPKFRYIIPFEVYDDANSNAFILLAVWAMDNKQNPLARYIGQVWQAINYYKSLFGENIIIVGDFNSNQIWDEKERLGNHTDVVNFLKNFNIESLYHKRFNERQGKESIKTFFMHRNSEKSYHIDYAFASENIIKNGFEITIENLNNWIDKSDHLPIIIDLPAFKSALKINNTYSDFVSRHLNEIYEVSEFRFQKEFNIIKNLASDLDNNKAFDKDKEKLISFVAAMKEINTLLSQIK